MTKRDFIGVIVGLCLLAFCLIASMSYGAECVPPKKDDITLTDKNTLALRGPVDEVTVTQVVKRLHEAPLDQKLYLFLDTPGGQVDAGKVLIHALMNTNRDVTCIISTAYSMGFVISQVCKERIILPFSSMMQHVVWYGLRGEGPNNRSYVNKVDAEMKLLDKMQADRLGMSLKDFENKIRDDWWIDGENILKAKVADKIVTKISCSQELTEKSTFLDYDFLFAKLTLVYSGCPLVTQPTSTALVFSYDIDPAVKQAVTRKAESKVTAHTRHREWLYQQTPSKPRVPSDRALP